MVGGQEPGSCLTFADRNQISAVLPGSVFRSGLVQQLDKIADRFALTIYPRSFGTEFLRSRLLQERCEFLDGLLDDGMRCSPSRPENACPPIYAFELIRKDKATDVIAFGNLDFKRVTFSLAGDGTYERQADALIGGQRRQEPIWCLPARGRLVGQS